MGALGLSGGGLAVRPPPVSRLASWPVAGGRNGASGSAVTALAPRLAVEAVEVVEVVGARRVGYRARRRCP